MHFGSLCALFLSKNILYASMHNDGVLKPNAHCIRGQLFPTEAMVKVSDHLCLRAHGHNWRYNWTTKGGSKDHGPSICLYTKSAVIRSILKSPQSCKI